MYKQLYNNALHHFRLYKKRGFIELYLPLVNVVLLQNSIYFETLAYY